MDKSWIGLRISDYFRYKSGVISFLDWAFHEDRKQYRRGDFYERICCPCKSCLNGFMYDHNTVLEHLICTGWWPHYTVWTSHGEEITYPSIDNDVENRIEDIGGDNVVEMLEEMRAANADSHENDNMFGDCNNFYDALKAAEEPIAPGINSMSRLSFLLRMFQIKVMNKATSKLMSDVLKFIEELLNNPKDFPQSWYDAKKQFRVLGLKCERSDPCKNDCMLYTKENACLNSFLQCGEGRYEENTSSNARGKKRSRKVLCYFPLIPRLCLFMSSKTTKWMTWHHNNKSRDGLMRHPTDSDKWAAFDNKHALFAEETRIVRLGLASDGFNPLKNIRQIPYGQW
jgi:hypothetical protein